METLRIVPTEKIPTDVRDCSDKELLSLYRICLEMERLCEAEAGIGLSAVQVGQPLRLYVVRYDGKYRYYVNCDYEPMEEIKINSIEGCLSIKKQDGTFRYYEVKRFSAVCVKGQELIAEEKPKLRPFSEELTGIYSVVHQHEIDHARSPITGKPTLISEIGTEIEIWR